MEDIHYIKCPCCDETIRVEGNMSISLRVRSSSAVDDTLKEIGLTLEDIQANFVTGSKISDIKKMREVYTLGLKEAKELYEAAVEG